MYVCLCKGITERDVQRCLRAGHTTPAALSAALGFDDPSTCGRCARDVKALLQDGAGTDGLCAAVCAASRVSGLRSATPPQPEAWEARRGGYTMGTDPRVATPAG